MYHKQYEITESPKISQRQLLWRLESTKVSLAVIVGDLICFLSGHGIAHATLFSSR